MVKIIQKRVRSVERFISTLQDGESFYIGLSNLEDFQDKLERIGFSDKLNNGEQVLPSILGRIS